MTPSWVQPKSLTDCRKKMQKSYRNPRKKPLTQKIKKMVHMKVNLSPSWITSSGPQASSRVASPTPPTTPMKGPSKGHDQSPDASTASPPDSTPRHTLAKDLVIEFDEDGFPLCFQKAPKRVLQTVSRSSSMSTLLYPEECPDDFPKHRIDNDGFPVFGSPPDDATPIGKLVSSPERNLTIDGNPRRRKVRFVFFLCPQDT